MPTPTMRTGLVGDIEASDAERDVVDTVGGLMRAFATDACVVAGRYACAHRRRVVSGDDMRRALMYCARTFFETYGDNELIERVQREIDDESGDEEEGESGESGESGEDSGEEEEGESGEGGEDSGEEEGGESGEGIGDEDEDEEESGESGEESCDESDPDATPDESDTQLARHVDVIAQTWHLWEPDDPVHRLIKEAIDNTAVPKKA